MSGLLIRNGRLLDPASGIDQVMDLRIEGRHIAALGEKLEGNADDRQIDASGQVVCPGLVDLRARLREPGFEYKATIASETRAAAAAGITTLCCPPDTNPVIDTPAVVELIHQRARESGFCRVETLGALTRGLAGEQLAGMAALLEAGCSGLSNGGRPIQATDVLRHALEYASSFRGTVFLHPEDHWLARDGLVHESALSTRQGLPGIPETAETVGLSRDLLLVEQTGARAHFCNLSTARGIDMIRAAKARGLPITADVSIHHLHLTEMDTADFNALAHVRPPLRSQRDRDALRAAVTDGTVDVITSDHQPHQADAKLAPFPSTEPGISGLDTLLPLALRLVEELALDLNHVIGALSWRPAQVLGLDSGRLQSGAPADICIYDPHQVRRVDPREFVSEGQNTPFGGWMLAGRVTHTLRDGLLVYALTS